jgi:dCTP deaminase
MVLSDRSIKEAIAQGRIIIDPLGDDCVQPSSVDLHSDQYFRVFRNHTQRVIDVRDAQEDLTELIDVGPDSPMILHPGEFMLGSTTERIAIPDDIVASASSSTPRPDSSTPAGTGTSRWSCPTSRTCPSRSIPA